METDLTEARVTEVHATSNVTLLSPVRVTAMLQDRSELQVMKFRTTCTDCVPNM